MDNTGGNARQENGIEKTVLMTFTLYVVTLMLLSIRLNWQYWIPLMLATCLIVAFGIHFSHYKTYSVRSMITTVLINLCVVVVGIHLQNFVVFLPMHFTLAVVVSLYGIPSNSTISVGSVLFVALELILTRGDELPANLDISNTMAVVQQAGNIIIFEIAITVWLKNRFHSMQRTRSIIEALKQAEHSKDDFLANVSHEIRTPINTISGMSEIIMQEDDIDKIKEYVRQIHNASGNLVAIVNDVMDFTEMQSDKVEIEEEYYNISSTINDIVNMMVALKGEKDIEIIVNVSPDLPSVLCGDEKKIRRVVMNLVNNAIKFTESGYIELNVSGRRESYGVNLCISVKDTGIGIREENLEKLFASFNQVDTRRNRAEGGIGLGLAISKAITEKMGGVISVNSKFGMGSTFLIVVPQGVIDDTPIVQIKHKENVKAICYINMEQFRLKDIRDSYTANIAGIIGGSSVECIYCKSFEEMKRRLDREQFTHAFISITEYIENQEFFDELSKKCRLGVVLDRKFDSSIQNEFIYRLYKPCFLLSIGAFFNNNQLDTTVRQYQFKTKDAHILVVDDNLMNIRVVEGLLKRYEVSITYALSGAEALEKIESMDYDFVFMDHMMPEMDGVETMQRIRAKGGLYYKNIPIIALTANAIAGSRDMFLRIGFADFLEKPVEVSVLERVLKRNLPQSKIIYLEKEDIVQEAVEKAKEDEFAIGNLNCEKGLAYCGGKTAYLGILAECCKGYKDTKKLLDDLYESKDWKNYCIQIHALKSSMRSIGADDCGELAAELEKAAKDGNYDYILAHHIKAMEFYTDVIHMIAKSEFVDFDESNLMEESVDNVADAMERLPEIEYAELVDCKSKFEEAAFELDVEKMSALLDYMMQYRFGECILKSKLSKVENKINQGDYFSAGSLLTQIVEQELGKRGNV